MRLFSKELTKPLKGLTVDERYALVLVGLMKAGIDEETQERIIAAVESERRDLDNVNSRQA